MDFYLLRPAPLSRYGSRLIFRSCHKSHHLNILSAAKKGSKTVDILSEEDRLDERLARRKAQVPLKTEKLDWDINIICSKIDSGEINLEPEYQRKYVMGAKHASRLVTTALRGRVIPGAIVHERYDDRLKKKVFDIVDGKQRLMTLPSFKAGKGPGPTRLTLDDEDAAREDYEGIAWDDLHDMEKSDFNSFKMTIQSIPDSTPPDVVFEIYMDINSGRTEHSVQQLRHAAYYDNYIKLLVELAETEEGRVYREWHGKKSEMQEDQEMLLRFFAFHSAAGTCPRFIAYQSRPSMREFLNKELQSVSPQGNTIKKRLTEDELESKRSAFKEAVQIIKSLKLEEEVEGLSFKSYPYLLEMTMVVLASLLSQPSKTKLKNKLNQNAREIIGDYSIAFKRPAKDVCSDAEGGKAQNLWKAVPSIHTFTRRYEALESVFKKHSQDTQGARTFSKEVKNKLFNEKKPCGICGKPIVDISHGEVDHIDPFSKGGPTTEDNAMLVHLLCNRQKGHK